MFELTSCTCQRRTHRDLDIVQSTSIRSHLPGSRVGSEHFQNDRTNSSHAATTLQRNDIHVNRSANINPIQRIIPNIDEARPGQSLEGVPVDARSDSEESGSIDHALADLLRNAQIREVNIRRDTSTQNRSSPLINNNLQG